MADTIDTEIYVIVVAYGSPLLLDSCLTHIGDKFQVFVVDNSSSPATRTTIERHDAYYLDPGCNLGFAGGVNFALSEIFSLVSDEALIPDILLLNPDATVTPDVVQYLHGVLASDSCLAAVAPGQHRPGSTAADRVCWPFPSPTQMWLQAIGLGRFQRRCEFLIGSVLLVKGTVFFEIGGFDEQFFLYAEETDWQRRATLAGWRVGYCPEVVAEHLGAGTDNNTVQREVRFHAAHERYVRKWFGLSGWYSFRFAQIFSSFVRVILLRGDHRKIAWNRLILYVRSPNSVARRTLTLSNRCVSTIPRFYRQTGPSSTE